MWVKKKTRKRSVFDWCTDSLIEREKRRKRRERKSRERERERARLKFQHKPNGSSKSWRESVLLFFTLLFSDISASYLSLVLLLQFLPYGTRSFSNLFPSCLFNRDLLFYFCWEVNFAVTSLRIWIYAWIVRKCRKQQWFLSEILDFISLLIF